MDSSSLRNDLCSRARITKALAERDTVSACLFYGHINFNDEPKARCRKKVPPKVEQINVFRAHTPEYSRKNTPRERIGPHGLRSLSTVRQMQQNPHFLEEGNESGEPRCRRTCQGLWPWQRREIDLRREAASALADKKFRLARIAERLDRVHARKASHKDHELGNDEKSHHSQCRVPARPPIPSQLLPTPPKTNLQGEQTSIRLQRTLDRIEKLAYADVFRRQGKVRQISVQ